MYGSVLSPGLQHSTLYSLWVVIKSSQKASQNSVNSCVTLPPVRDSISESTGHGEHNIEHLHAAPGELGERTGGCSWHKCTPKVSAGYPESQSFPPSLQQAINPTHHCAAKSRGMVGLCLPECILQALP